jgi:hypothetical protein
MRNTSDLLAPTTHYPTFSLHKSLAQVLNKLAMFYGNRMFITVFTKATHFPFLIFANTGWAISRLTLVRDLNALLSTDLRPTLY